MSSTSSGTTLRGNFCNKTKSIFCSLVVITLHPHSARNKWHVMGEERGVKGRLRDLADEQRFNFFSTTSTNLEKLSPAWPLRYPITQTLATPSLEITKFSETCLVFATKKKRLDSCLFHEHATRLKPLWARLVHSSSCFPVLYGHSILGLWTWKSHIALGVKNIRNETPNSSWHKR